MERQFGFMSFKWDRNNDMSMYKSKRLYDRHTITCLNSLSGKLRKPNQFDIKKR